MVVTKNQIRPRSLKAHFTNDEIVTMSLDGAVREIDLGLGANELPVIGSISLKTHIEADYTNLDPVNPFVRVNVAGLTDSARISFIDDFVSAGPPMQTLLGFTSLFAPTGGGKSVPGDFFYEISANGLSSWIPEFRYLENSTVLEEGGWAPPLPLIMVGILIVNPVGGFTGGDPANSMDVFVYYNVISY